MFYTKTFCYIYRKQSSGTRARLCVTISEESVCAEQHNQEMTSSVFSKALSNGHHFPILRQRKQGSESLQEHLYGILSIPQWY